MSPRPAPRARNTKTYAVCDDHISELLASDRGLRCRRDDSALPGWFVCSDLPQAGAHRAALATFRLQSVVLGEDTHPARRLAQNRRIRLSFPMRYFRYWYLLPMRTYVLAYVQAFDVWFYADASALVDTSWGSRVFSVGNHSSSMEFENVVEASSLDAFARASTLDPVSGLTIGRPDVPSPGRTDYELMQAIATAWQRDCEVFAVFAPAAAPGMVQIQFEERSRGAGAACTILRVDALNRAQGLTFTALYPFLQFVPAADDPAPRRDAQPERTRRRLALRLSSVGQKLFAASALWRSLDLWNVMIERRDQSYAERCSAHFAPPPAGRGPQAW